LVAVSFLGLVSPSYGLLICKKRLAKLFELTMDKKLGALAERGPLNARDVVDVLDTWIVTRKVIVEKDNGLYFQSFEALLIFLVLVFFGLLGGGCNAVFSNVFIFGSVACPSACWHAVCAVVTDPAKRSL